MNILTKLWCYLLTNVQFFINKQMFLEFGLFELIEDLFIF